MRHRAFKRMIVLVAVAGGLVCAMAGVWQFSKSRTMQLFTPPMGNVQTMQKVVALTFDDGPNRDDAAELIAILEKANAKATFFVVGTNLAGCPEIGRKLVTAGHGLGNHSWSHKQLVLTTIRDITFEVEATDQAIRDAGQIDEIYFRPPYGKKLLLLPYYLKQHARKTILWDIEADSLPIDAGDSEVIFKKTIERLTPGSIILLHPWGASREATRDALPRILKAIADQGYRITTVGDLLKLDGR
jgi:peptidoglycan/xylan/chitin deacetylase (PgdA/CDA1 family)